MDVIKLYNVIYFEDTIAQFCFLLVIIQLNCSYMISRLGINNFITINPRPMIILSNDFCLLLLRKMT